MPLELTGVDDKVAVITGAGRMRGIGRSIALALARGGCDVVVTGTGRAPEHYPDEIGSIVAYLCPEQGAWISGQLYSVDGGQLARR